MVEPVEERAGRRCAEAAVECIELSLGDVKSHMLTQISMHDDFLNDYPTVSILSNSMRKLYVIVLNI